MSTTPVKFKIELSESAKALIERLGSRTGMGAVVARDIDRENINTCAAIKTKLRVAGKSIRGKKESSTGNYPYPHRITGRLQQSISSTSAIVEMGGDGLKIRSALGSGVGSGSESVRYAAIHEYGGTINIKSRPTRSVGGDPLHPFVGAYGLKHPMTKAYSITIPERAYVRPTIKERANRYSERVSNGLIRYLNRGQN